MPRADEATDYLSPKTMAEAHSRWRAAESQAGAAWGGFLEWPAASVAALIDSNPFQVHEPHAIGMGARLSPRFAAERENGVHATVVYAAADAQLYANTPRADQIGGRVGILHDWAISRDFILRAQGDLSRVRDRLDSRQVVTGRTGGTPFDIEAASLALSAQKTFERLFLVPSATLTKSSFDDASTVRTTTGAPALSAQTAVTSKARVGYWLGPAIFTFAEPAANWRVLDVGNERSSGVRALAGVGFDRLGLYGGEIYGGFQRQGFSRTQSSVSEPLVGGRLSWWPSPAWTVSARFDRSLEQTAIGTTGDPLGAPIDVRSGRLSLRYAPTVALWLEGGIEHEAVDYLGTRRRDRLTSLDATVAYACRHDLDLTADLRLTHVESTVAPASYRRAMAAVGAVYRY